MVIFPTASISVQSSPSLDQTKTNLCCFKEKNVAVIFFIEFQFIYKKKLELINKHESHTHYLYVCSLNNRKIRKRFRSHSEFHISGFSCRNQNTIFILILHVHTFHWEFFNTSYSIVLIWYKLSLKEKANDISIAYSNDQNQQMEPQLAWPSPGTDIIWDAKDNARCLRSHP